MNESEFGGTKLQRKPQQMPQQQQRPGSGPMPVGYGQPGGKISISDAIGLTTIRLGKVEQFIQRLQEEGGLNNSFDIPDNAQLIDKSVITNIISRIDSLEKRDGANMNEKIGRIENEIRSIRELLNATKSNFDSYVQSNDKRFEDVEVAFVELEKGLIIHDEDVSEMPNNLEGSSIVLDNNVKLIIDDNK